MRIRWKPHGCRVSAVQLTKVGSTNDAGRERLKMLSLLGNESTKIFQFPRSLSEIYIHCKIFT